MTRLLTVLLLAAALAGCYAPSTGTLITDAQTGRRMFVVQYGDGGEQTYVECDDGTFRDARYCDWSRDE